MAVLFLERITVFFSSFDNTVQTTPVDVINSKRLIKFKAGSRRQDELIWDLRLTAHFVELKSHTS